MQEPEEFRKKKPGEAHSINELIHHQWLDGET